MSKFNDITELIGNTPHFQLTRFAEDTNNEIYIKLEMNNPGRSVKDRIAWNMIRRAEENGRLTSGRTIVEPTSGNTGIGLAMLGAARGYQVILTMPDTMSKERRMLLKAFGAELILTPGNNGMNGAIDKAKELAENNGDFYMPNQFDNPANPEIHRLTTAREIFVDFGRELDYVVLGVGTGGTITGVGRFFKDKSPQTKIIAVEPADSPVISGGKPGSHKIQGIGAGFIPEILATEVIDEVITVADDAAHEAARELAEKEGLLVGISAGAAAAAVRKLGERVGPGQKILTLAPDSGERYLTTELFDADH